MIFWRHASILASVTRGKGEVGREGEKIPGEDTRSLVAYT